MADRIIQKPTADGSSYQVLLKDQGAGVFSEQVATISGGASGAQTVALQGDLVSGDEWSVDVTLSSSANAVSSFAIPSTSRGMVLKNASANCRFNLEGSLVSTNKTTAGTNNTGTSYLGQYNTFGSGDKIVRKFEPGSVPATLYVNSATASATFTVEFF